VAAALAVGAVLVLRSTESGRAESDPLAHEASPIEHGVEHAPGELAAAEDLAEPAVARVAIDVQAEPVAPDAAEPSTTKRERNDGYVVGRCIDQAGFGIADVVVSSPGSKALTQGDGRFELAIDLGQRVQRSYYVTLELAGFGGYGAEVVVQAGERTDMGEVLLRQRGTVSGTVFDASGAPLGDAKLQVEESLAVVQGSKFTGADHPVLMTNCEADGTFRVVDVPSGDIRLWAGKEGMAWTPSDPIEVPAGGEVHDVELTVHPLAPEDTIGLLIVDPTGEPVPFAHVTFRYNARFRSGMGTANADKHGRLVKFLDVRATHSFLASDPDGEHRSTLVENVPPGARDLIVQLGAYKSFVLRVRDAAGEPVRTFRTRLDMVGSSLSTPEAVLRKQELGVADASLPPQDFKLTIEAEGFRLVELGPYAPPTTPPVIEVVLERMPAMRGRITFAGTPVANASVSLHESRPTGSLVVNGFPARSERQASASGMTDATGHFALTLRQAGEYLLRAEAKGFAPAESGPFSLDPTSGTEGLNAVLVRGGAIAGRVIVYADQDARGVIVGASRGDGFAVTHRADANGTFLFERLTPGKWMVEVRAEEIHTSSTSSSSNDSEELHAVPWNCEVADGRTTHYDLDERLMHQATLRGQLVLGEVDVAGWRAELQAVEGGSAAKTASLDGDGRFVIAMPAAGAHTLSIQSSVGQHSFVNVYDKVVLDFGDNSWNFQESTGTLEGQLGPGHLPASTHLALHIGADNRPRFSFNLIPSSDGSFEVQGVPSGPATLTWLGLDETSEGSNGSRTITVAPDDTTVVTVP
jgi:hypothetical protein